MSESVDTLEAWLGTATNKLTQTGKERITLEITSHFNDAEVSYRANGLADVDAQARALADLGDPKEAGRRFKKRHLTQSEAAFLENRLNQYQKWRKPWTQLLFWIFLGWLYIVQRRDHSFLPLLVICGLLFVAQSFSLALASRRGFRALLRLMLALDNLAYLSMFLIFSIYGHLFPAAVALLMTSWRWVSAFRLWLKIGKLADVSHEMRPPGAIVS